MTTLHDTHQPISEELRRCLAGCVACRDACLAAIAHCIETRGDDETAPHVQLLRDCADVCERTAAAIEQTGERDDALLKECVEIVGRCARELPRDFPDDAKLQAVGTAAVDCAKLCESVMAPKPSQDKVSADSFPGSDPPAR